MGVFVAVLVGVNVAIGGIGGFVAVLVAGAVGVNVAVLVGVNVAVLDGV